MRLDPGKFIGGWVTITCSGKAYATYRDMVISMGLDRYIQVSPKNGQEWKVVEAKTHLHNDSLLVLGLINSENEICLIGSDGVSLLEESKVPERTSFKKKTMYIEFEETEILLK